MEYVIWFLVGIIFIYIIYYIFFIRNARRDTKGSVEVEYLIKLYSLDINKFSYYKFVRVIGVVSSIDISLVSIIVAFVKGLVWQLLFSILIVLPVIIISFMLLGNYYKKKQLKDNSKELEKEKKYLEKLEKKKKKKKKKKEK